MGEFLLKMIGFNKIPSLSFLTDLIDQVVCYGTVLIIFTFLESSVALFSLSRNYLFCGYQMTQVEESTIQYLFRTTELRGLTRQNTLSSLHSFLRGSCPMFVPFLNSLRDWGSRTVRCSSSRTDPLHYEGYRATTTELIITRGGETFHGTIVNSVLSR